MRGTVHRGAVGQVHQPVKANAPAAQALEGPRHDAPHNEGTVRLAGHPVGEVRDRTVFKIGEEVAASGGDDPFHGLIGQFLVVADKIVDRLAHILALGHGDLLDGVLKFDARGIQLFRQIRPVQQFEGGDAMPGQPVLQHSADQLPGMGGVEILGRRAAQSGLILGDDAFVGSLGRTARQHGQAVEFHGVGVERFLGHAHGGHPAVAQHILGRLDGVSAVLGRHLEAPGGGRRLADEDFVVDGAGHETLAQ